MIQRTLELATANSKLKKGIAERKSLGAALRARGIDSTKLIAKSHTLEKRLQKFARQILSTQENERKEMSVKLQDEIAQILLGIHIRLLALKNEVYANQADVDKEIGILQQLVKTSVESIHRFVGQFGGSDNKV